MGDPRRLHKKYATPMHPWRKETIEADAALRKEYAFKTKQEMWRMSSLLRTFKNQAKKLIALRTVQAERERKQLLQRLERMGLISPNTKLDSILGLTIKDIFERRLQSVLCRKGLAHSMKQARQFIVHNHVMVGGKKVTSPSYLVAKAEEGHVAFSMRSPFLNSEHPERVIPQKAIPQKTTAAKQTVPKKKDTKENTRSGAVDAQAVSAEVTSTTTSVTINSPVEIADNKSNGNNKPSKHNIVNPDGVAIKEEAGSGI